MNRKTIKSIAGQVSVALILLWMFGGESMIAADPQTGSGAGGSGQEIEVQGRVVCLAEEMNDKYSTDLPTSHDHLWGFRTVDGKYFTLLRGKLSEGLFVDKRLREKELIIKGRTFPGTLILEPTHLRSVKNGEVHEIYYYCDICAIKTLYPGECMCCQGPVELVEERAKAKDEG